MANPTYYNFVGKVEQPYNLSPGHDLTLDNIYTFNDTFMEQKQIGAQLQSPTEQYERQRHDSLLSYTPSTLSNPSPHQAEAQPCFSTAQMLSEDYLPRPTNMSRTNSQYTTFTNNPQRHGQNRLSFGDGTENSAVAMSRSSTHHSNMSAGYQVRQAAPQPRATEAQFDFTGSVTPGFSQIVPTTRMRRDSTLTTEDGSNLLYGYRPQSASTTQPSDLGGMLSYTVRENETWGQSLASTE
jgi:hypothetical protein